MLLELPSQLKLAAQRVVHNGHKVGEIEGEGGREGEREGEREGGRERGGRKWEERGGRRRKQGRD